MSDENRGLMWVLLKQLRPGTDLSRVALPTFVLEPRSFLSKLSDHYYHADLLSRYASGRPRSHPRDAEGPQETVPAWATSVRAPIAGEPGTLCAPEPWHC